MTYMACFLSFINTFYAPEKILTRATHLLVSVPKFPWRNTRKKHLTTLCLSIMSADDRYEEKNDATGGDVPAGDATDNSYVSRTGQYEIPVQSDNKPIKDPIDPATADSDETLGMFDEADTLHHSELWY